MATEPCQLPLAIERLRHHRRGNTKNGNKWLAWAFVEAANFTVRFSPEAKRYYQRKAAKTKRVVAIKAVANKLARACFYVMRDGTPFEPKRCFG